MGCNRREDQEKLYDKLYVAIQARPADWGAVVEEVKRGGL